MAEKKRAEAEAIVAEAEAIVSEPDAAFKSSAYGRALTALKAAHKDEFDDILAGIYGKAGFVYQPRLTPEERKREQLRALAAELGVEVVG